MYVQFIEHGERHTGHVVGHCGNMFYIQPDDWPEQDFPHLIQRDRIVVIDEEKEAV